MTTTTKPPMPTWLKHQLIQTGHWNADGITRKAHLRTHTCGQLVLTGLDADTAAIPTTCDPTWLTPLGEALALIEGRHTYDYWITAQTIDGPRTSPTITGRPATNTGSTRTLPTHKCQTHPLPHYDIPPTPRKAHHDHPPF